MLGWMSRRGLLNAFLASPAISREMASGDSTMADSADSRITLVEANASALSARLAELEGNFAKEMDRYDVRRFGAVWDGNTHPVSERYKTLAAAQAVYPHVTSLKDEIDWAALQAAVNRVILDWAASGDLVFGGVVTLPSGTGRLNRTVTLPFRQVYVNESAPAVSLRGQGRSATGLVWQTDVGALPVAAIDYGRALVANGKVSWKEALTPAGVSSDSELADFHMIGPGYFWGYPAPTSRSDFLAKYGFDAGTGWAKAYNAGAPLVGQIRGNYDGIRLPDRVGIRDVSITGFHAGIRMTGGQRLMECVRIFNCYYGLYLERNLAHHGDFVLLKCDISGRFACVGLAPEAAWFGTSIATIYNQSPYAFFKLASEKTRIPSRAQAVKSYGDHWPSLMEHSSFLNCQFESIGNAVIADGNAVCQHDLRHVDIACCAYVEVLDRSFPTTALHPSGEVRRSASVFDVRCAANVSLRTPMAPERWPTRDAMFRTTEAVSGLAIEGVDAFVATANAAGRQVFNLAGTLSGGSVRLRGDDWVGGVWRATNAGVANRKIVRGDLLGLCENLIEQHTASRPGVVGVAKESNVVGGEVNLCVADFNGSALSANKELGASSTSALGVDITYSDKTPGKIRQARAGEPVIGRSIGSNTAWTTWQFVLLNPSGR